MAIRESGRPGENGYILYIKPGYHGTESAGVVAYATANAAFPHESTGDQFFCESQFESYRALGFEIMDSVLKGAGRSPERRDAEAGQDAAVRRQARDLIRALDAAEPTMTRQLPRLADALKLLDKDDLSDVRKILAPPKP